MIAHFFHFLNKTLQKNTNVIVETIILIYRYWCFKMNKRTSTVLLATIVIVSLLPFGKRRQTFIVGVFSSIGDSGSLSLLSFSICCSLEHISSILDLLLTKVVWLVIVFTLVPGLSLESVEMIQLKNRSYIVSS